MTVVVLATASVVLCLAAATWVVATALRRSHHDEATMRLLTLFGPAVTEAQRDPRALVPWADMARTARARFPSAFASLDAAAPEPPFPFSPTFIDGVHARWTAEWLAWERQHDLTYKQRAAAVEARIERAAADDAALLRSELAAVEQDKLQRYQERYEEYVRISKAIAGLKGES